MPPYRSDSSRSSGKRSSRSARRSERPKRAPAPREEELVELEYAEALGTTVDEAIKNALEILGADADEVEVQVLQKGVRSFLGLGRNTPFRVRVSWREDLDQEVLEEEVSPLEEAEPPVLELPSRPEPPPPPAPRKAPQVTRTEASPRVPAAPVPATAGSSAVEGQTRQLLQAMGFQTRVDVSPGDQEIWIRIKVDDEDDAYLLHGRRGETRSALQHLLQRLVAPRAENGPSVLVDVNGLWEGRLDDLRSEALDLASRAIAEGRAFRTRPLPSEERRIVHRALADRTDVRTHSEGDGREKRVVISPTSVA